MMHLEICVEDASGKLLLESILPRLIRNAVTWRVHSYRGIGRLPKNLRSSDNADHRILLDNLPKLIRGCAATPHVTALIVVVDTDDKNCTEFLGELRAVHNQIAPLSNVIFRLAIEEMEAWLLGDQNAIRKAYPNAINATLKAYVPDSVCGTWEVLANALYPGGAQKLKAESWPAPGRAKCEWAAKIGEFLDFEANTSPSFHKLLEAFAPYR